VENTTHAFPPRAMPSSEALASAPLLPWYVAVAIAAAGLMTVLKAGRDSVRRGGAVVALGGFGLLMVQALKLTRAGSGDLTTPFLVAFAAIGTIGAVRVITHPRPVFAALYFILTVLAAAAIFLVLAAEFLAFALIIVYAGAILITYMFVLMLAHQSPEDEIGRIGAEDYDRVPREPMVAVLLGFFLVAALGSVIERVPTLTREAAAIGPREAAFERAEALQRMPQQLLAQARLQDAEAVALAADDRGRVSFMQGETLQVRIRTNAGEIRVVTVDPAASVDNVQLVGLDLVARYPASLELAGVILLMAMFGAVVLARRQIELGEDERRKAAGMAGMVLDLPENERGGA